MAYFYGPGYARIWSEALVLDGHNDLWSSTCAEVADYLGISTEEAGRSLEDSWSDHSRLAMESKEARESYYRSNEEAILFAMYWHSLRADTYALVSVAALHSAERFSDGPSILDFGHGVGSTGLLLARHHFDVSMLDISRPLHDFAKWRFERRELSARFATETEEMEALGPFDAIVSLDVLEHLEEPLKAIRMFHRVLKPGGVLLLNIAFDPSQPGHLLRRRLGLVDRIRAEGFQKASPDGAVQIYYKDPTMISGRRLGRGTRRAVDVVVAAWEDSLHSGNMVVSRAPRVLRSYGSPGNLPGSDAQPLR
jgi:SAM-dependent methyltransferase